MTTPGGLTMIQSGKIVQYVATRQDAPGYVSCEGFDPPVYLTEDEAGLGVVYGCGEAHPFTDDGVPDCGVDLCHGRPTDDEPAHPEA